MTFKTLAVATSMLALAACGDSAPNADALRGANFVANQAGVTITLAFDENEMMVNGRVVNLYHGPYSVDGNKIRFGNMGATMMMGPANAMQVEQEYFQFLNTVETYDFANGTLTLHGANGNDITFTQVEQLPDAE